MTKSTRNIILLIIAIIITTIYINKCNRKNYHFTKIMYTVYDGNNNLISDTTIYQLGEVKSFKDDEGNWSEFGIQNYDGYYVYKYISAPIKEGNKTLFDVKDKNGEYYVVINGAKGTITISQTKSKNDEFLFLIIYMD